MRFSSLFIYTTTVAGCLITAFANAQQEPTLIERLSARRDLELAQMDLRHYWQIDFPRQQRYLNAAIELTKREIRDLQVRLRQYQPFTRFSTGDPFMITIQNTQMCLREAELRLRDLWAERNALVRFHADQYRELELRVLQARLRVLDLEPEDEPHSTQVTVDPSI